MYEFVRIIRSRRFHPYQKSSTSRIATAATEIPSDACHILRRSATKSQTNGSDDRKNSQTVEQAVTRSLAADVKEMDEHR